MLVLQCTWKLERERMKEMQCNLLAAALWLPDPLDMP